MNYRQKSQIGSIFLAGLLMALGLTFFKFLPMKIWGNDILFDASFHITSAAFILYIIWFFIDQNKTWRIPFFMFAVLIFSVISFQRIYSNAHNDMGLFLGFIISISSIYISDSKRIKGKFKF